jgi:hypothetical protein
MHLKVSFTVRKQICPAKIAKRARYGIAANREESEPLSQQDDETLAMRSGGVDVERASASISADVD